MTCWAGRRIVGQLSGGERPNSSQRDEEREDVCGHLDPYPSSELIKQRRRFPP